MKTIYKYLSDDFPIESHLKSPEIKLSLVRTLNDPYEGQLTKQAIDMFSNIFVNHSDVFINYKIENGIEKSKELAIAAIVSVLDNTCITSFSETQRNLLMWAHYASQHKGVCIGYSSKLLNKEGVEELMKVNYDSVLYDQEYLDELELVTDFDSEEINSFCKHLFTTKSNDWSYEKEHRYISTCESANRVVVHSPYDMLSQEAMNEIERAESNKTHKITKKESSIEIYNIRNDEQQRIATKNGGELETILAENHEVSYFSTIEKNKIKSIYLGVLFDKEREREILKIIEEDVNLKHINVYRYIISDERYELKPDKIYPTSTRTIAVNQDSQLNYI